MLLVSAVKVEIASMMEWFRIWIYGMTVEENEACWCSEDEEVVEGVKGGREREDIRFSGAFWNRLYSKSSY